MFNKSLVNTKALQAAQNDVDALINEFERLVFEATEPNGVTVSLKGDMTLHGVSGDALTPVSVMDAYHLAKVKLDHARAVGLVRVRNAILKQYKFDVKNLVPEIAKAISTLEQKDTSGAA